MGFRRLLSSIGVGTATVDARLEKSEFEPGEEVRGIVEIRGGDADQDVNGLRLEVQTYYKRESGDTTVTETGTIERFPLLRAPASAARHARRGPVRVPTA